MQRFGLTAISTVALSAHFYQISFFLRISTFARNMNWNVQSGFAAMYIIVISNKTYSLSRQIHLFFSKILPLRSDSNLRWIHRKEWEKKIFVQILIGIGIYILAASWMNLTWIEFGGWNVIWNHLLKNYCCTCSRTYNIDDFCSCCDLYRMISFHCVFRHLISRNSLGLGFPIQGLGCQDSAPFTCQDIK